MICQECCNTLHSKCRNGAWATGTWCSCQHRVKGHPAMGDKEDRQNIQRQNAAKQDKNVNKGDSQTNKRQGEYDKGKGN